MRTHLTRTALLALVVPAFFALGACRDPAPGTPDASADARGDTVDLSQPLRLGDVSVRGAPTTHGADAATVDRRARDTLLGQPEFVPTERPGLGPFTLDGTWRVSLGDPRDGSGQVIGTVYVKLTLHQPRATGPLQAAYTTEAFVGEALAGTRPQEEETSALLLGVVEECALNLTKQVRVDRADDGALLELLGRKDDPELLGFAITAARARRLKRAAPTLVALLGHEQRDVVNQAAAALGDLGDEKAVSALIDAGSRVDPLDRLPVLYALGEIGGPQAILYLQTLAGSDVDLRVANAAQQALERARSKDGGPTDKSGH